MSSFWLRFFHFHFYLKLGASSPCSRPFFVRWILCTHVRPSCNDNITPDLNCCPRISNMRIPYWPNTFYPMLMSLLHLLLFFHVCFGWNITYQIQTSFASLIWSHVISSNTPDRINIHIWRGNDEWRTYNRRLSRMTY